MLAPLAGDSPTGPDLRKQFAPDNPYRKMKDARLTARRLESQAIWDDAGPHEKPNWRAIQDMGRDLLAGSSKDLEVAAWLVEALVREHGFAGARDGFRLCRELAERFWDQLHPDPDPEDTDDRPLRVAALAGLDGEDADGTLIRPLLNVSLVQSGEFGPIGVSAYDHAAAMEQIADPNEREKRIAHGAIPMDSIKKALTSTPASFFKRVISDLSEASREFEALCGALNQRCANSSGPSGANIRGALERCHLRLRAVFPAGFDTPIEVVPAATPAAGRGQTVGPIRSREQAFELIRQVAQFFRETEPHSVLSWQLDECVRWGRMTLPDLLTDLISDGSTREALFKRVGIPNPAQQQSS